VAPPTCCDPARGHEFPNAEIQVHPGRDCVLAQRLPPNPHASQREECFVDVGPFVIADAQTTELIQPGETSARRPTATAPNRCRASCSASPTLAECDAPASRAGWGVPPSRCRSESSNRSRASQGARARSVAESQGRRFSAGDHWPDKTPPFKPDLSPQKSPKIPPARTSRGGRNIRLFSDRLTSRRCRPIFPGRSEMWACVHSDIGMLGSWECRSPRSGAVVPADKSPDAVTKSANA
jgi:hypothetical protein